MTSYDWRQRWQDKTAGGFEIVDVRESCSGLAFVIWADEYFMILHCELDGGYSDEGQGHAYDLLPVEQPHYDDEKSDPALVDTVDTIATLTAERDRLLTFIKDRVADRITLCGKHSCYHSRRICLEAEQVLAESEAAS